MTYEQHLIIVIEYLEGKTDIYDGNHRNTVRAWDKIWDDMRAEGLDPESAYDIKQYIKINN